MYIVLYEEDGYTKYRVDSDENREYMEETQQKKKYVQKVAKSVADGEVVIGDYNYSSLPIIPMWGNKRHQSTLVGTREAIDSYDLVRSGFANDLHDVAEIYWLVENAAGMEEDDLARFRDRLKINHIATVTTQDGANVRPYTQDIPYVARKTFLDDLKAQIYFDFGGLDVHTVSAGSTNDHLEAAYQPLDEEADELEFEVSKFILQLLKLMGINDEYPTYKRNRISNTAQQTQMVLSAAEYLDGETVLKHLPFITVDEVEEIQRRKQAEEMERMGMLIAQQKKQNRGTGNAQQGAEPQDEEESEEEEEEAENS